MPRRYSTHEVAEALERIGIRFVRQKGSHMRFSGVWRGRQRNVTLVSGQRQVPPRTLAQIIAQIGMRPADFKRLMEGDDIG